MVLIKILIFACLYKLLCECMRVHCFFYCVGCKFLYVLSCAASGVMNNDDTANVNTQFNHNTRE